MVSPSEVASPHCDLANSADAWDRSSRLRADLVREVRFAVWVRRLLADHDASSTDYQCS